ncbi:MAG: hypothetical protein J0L71_15240 [Candidatus Accumulibacter sp.]|uniref:hypothetical protein n=1 Tax=Accumulibacter sp. TaxID=2053492 RepID=UPI001AD33B33|nr:hypothetical protein [Accumulibacter sp.]MBN8519187.1 hypothetical protein [Accumulibacter sp.]
MFESVLSSVVAAVATVSVLAFLGKSWIAARLKASIEQEYKKQFEFFKRELDQKQKVELVAELLAEYMKTPYGEPVTREQRTLLNKLSLQASLWLPSELAIELSKRLQNKPDAKTPFDLILLARRELTGDTSITGHHVTLWDTQREKVADPILHYAQK